MEGNKMGWGGGSGQRVDGDLECGGRVAEGILKSCEMRKEWEREGREGLKKNWKR